MRGARQVTWRGSQAASRRRYLEKFDAVEVAAYDALVGRPGPDLQQAYLRDLAGAVGLRAGMHVLDAGAGTGAMSAILSGLQGIRITALEPAPEMLAVLRSRPELSRVATVQGFCDADSDAMHFPPAHFDVIVSRQLVNGLFDPLAAFRNWHRWLKPDGTIVVIDGLYARSDWTGAWAEEVDCFPAAACQGTALIPYLLEAAGCHVEAVGMMGAVNASPATRTPRLLVVARKRAIEPAATR
jgi:SAM-dependent methyltransferase